MAFLRGVLEKNMKNFPLPGVAKKKKISILNLSCALTPRGSLVSLFLSFFLSFFLFFPPLFFFFSYSHYSYCPLTLHPRCSYQCTISHRDAALPDTLTRARRSPLESLILRSLRQSVSHFGERDEWVSHGRDPWVRGRGGKSRRKGEKKRAKNGHRWQLISNLTNATSVPVPCSCQVLPYASTIEIYIFDIIQITVRGR